MDVDGCMDVNKNECKKEKKRPISHVYLSRLESIGGYHCWCPTKTSTVRNLTAS